jgi:hypothetical protein
MSTPPATPSDAPNSRGRTIIAVLTTLLAVLIVMDIFARRRKAAVQSLPHVTLWQA